MHEASGIQFPHASINEGVAGFAIAPPSKLPIIVSPLYPVVLRLEAVFDDAGEMVHDRHKKFTPNQFVKPSFVC
jgi:hypothetical protein